MKSTYIVTALAITLLNVNPAFAEGPGDLGEVEARTYFCSLLDGDGQSVDEVEVRANDKEVAIAKAAVATGRMEFGNGSLYLKVGVDVPKLVRISRINCENSGLE